VCKQCKSFGLRYPSKQPYSSLMLKHKFFCPLATLFFLEACFGTTSCQFQMRPKSCGLRNPEGTDGVARQSVFLPLSMALFCRFLVCMWSYSSLVAEHGHTEQNPPPTPPPLLCHPLARRHPLRTPCAVEVRSALVRVTD
jgi:hypothetical protein